MNISEEQVEKALDYLRDSYKEFAFWKGRVTQSEYLIKIAEAKEYLVVDKGTQEQKKSLARASEAYTEAVNNYEEATVKFTEIYSLRRAAELKISVFQSGIKAANQGLNL